MGEPTTLYQIRQTEAERLVEFRLEVGTRIRRMRRQRVCFLKANAPTRCGIPKGRLSMSSSECEMNFSSVEEDGFVIQAMIAVHRSEDPQPDVTEETDGLGMLFPAFYELDCSI